VDHDLFLNIISLSIVFGFLPADSRDLESSEPGISVPFRCVQISALLHSRRSHDSVALSCSLFVTIVKR